WEFFMPNPNGPLFSAFIHIYFTAEIGALSIGFYAESKGPFSHGPPRLKQERNTHETNKKNYDDRFGGFV
ncbi:MAG: hypothetical protein IJX89_02305, partial [Alphaproteobacteria bacterium]|nr:hypothetical protein [Alphaproteobacteria bacterium]